MLFAQNKSHLKNPTRWKRLTNNHTKAIHREKFMRESIKIKEIKMSIQKNVNIFFFLIKEVSNSDIRLGSTKKFNLGSI